MMYFMSGQLSFALLTSVKSSPSPTKATFASSRLEMYSICPDLSCLYIVEGTAPACMIPRSEIKCSFTLFATIKALSSA